MQRAETAFQNGRRFYLAKDLPRARREFDRAIDLILAASDQDPVDRAEMERRLEEMADAELRQALAQDPRLPRVHLLLGQTALFRGRLDEAVTLLQGELQVSPGEAMAYHLLGDAYSRQLKWDAAVAALQKSIWINPYFSGPYLLLGKAYMKKGDAAAAEGMLRQAVRYDPNNKAAHYLLGQLLQQAGRSDEARRELETAERLPGARER